MKYLLNYKSLINVVIITILTGSIALLLSAQTYAQGQSSPNVPNPMLPGGNTIAGPGIADFARDVNGGDTINILDYRSGPTVPICVTVRNEGNTDLTLDFAAKDITIGPGATSVLCGNIAAGADVTLKTDTAGQGLAQWRVDLVSFDD